MDIVYLSLYLLPFHLPDRVINGTKQAVNLKVDFNDDYIKPHLLLETCATTRCIEVQMIKDKSELNLQPAAPPLDSRHLQSHSCPASSSHGPAAKKLS